MFESLKGEESRVEATRANERKEESNGYLSPCLDILKIKGEGNRYSFPSFGCSKD